MSVESDQSDLELAALSTARDFAYCIYTQHLRLWQEEFSNGSGLVNPFTSSPDCEDPQIDLIQH